MLRKQNIHKLNVVGYYLSSPHLFFSLNFHFKSSRGVEGGFWSSIWRLRNNFCAIIFLFKPMLFAFLIAQKSATPTTKAVTSIVVTTVIVSVLSFEYQSIQQSKVVPEQKMLSRGLKTLWQGSCCSPERNPNKKNLRPHRSKNLSVPRSTKIEKLGSTIANCQKKGTVAFTSPFPTYWKLMLTTLSSTTAIGRNWAESFCPWKIQSIGNVESTR